MCVETSTSVTILILSILTFCPWLCDNTSMTTATGNGQVAMDGRIGHRISGGSHDVKPCEVRFGSV